MRQVFIYTQRFRCSLLDSPVDVSMQRQVLPPGLCRGGGCERTTTLGCSGLAFCRRLRSEPASLTTCPYRKPEQG